MAYPTETLSLEAYETLVGGHKNYQHCKKNRYHFMFQWDEPCHHPIHGYESHKIVGIAIYTILWLRGLHYFRD